MANGRLMAMNAPRYKFALTRFHVVLLVALGLSVFVLLAGQRILLAPIAIALFAVISLGVAFPQMTLFGPYICHGSCQRRCVALTFDDGPDACATPALLDLLQKRRVQAAFFCVGERVARNPELAARIVREGHLLENHSYAHHNTTNFFTVDRLRDELGRTQSAIEKAAGTAPKFFRPPMGLSNPRIFRAAREFGLTVIGWSARGLDTIGARQRRGDSHVPTETANEQTEWGRGRPHAEDAQRIVARIMRSLKPGGIILLHDGNIPVARLLSTVELLLDTLQTHEYQVERLDRMLP